GRVRQDAGAEAEVLHELLEDRGRPDASGAVGDEPDVAELAHGRAAGRLRILAALDAIAHRHLEVRRNLGADLAVAPAGEESREPAHVRPRRRAAGAATSSRRRTAATASARWSADAGPRRSGGSTSRAGCGPTPSTATPPSR